MKIGQTIKDLRKLKGVKQKDFCKIIGISQNALCQIEGDVAYPHSNTLKSIAKAFDMPEQMIYLLSIKESDVPKHKKEAYRILYPTIKQMIHSLIE